MTRAILLVAFGCFLVLVADRGLAFSLYFVACAALLAVVSFLVT